MVKTGKRLRAAYEAVDRETVHSPAEAIRIVRERASAKFDETVEAAFRLGIDPKKADQQLRGTVTLPAGTGKTVRVAVFASGEKAREAQESGAEFVGDDDLVERVQGGWLDFDAAIATPDMMPKVGRVARILGPRQLMPNPKTGTVTADVGRAVRELKGGKVTYRTDKVGGNVHLIIGKASFSEADLLRNFAAALEELIRAKPSTAKGKYVQAITLSSTMGPGIRVDPNVSPRDVVAQEAPA